MQYGAGQEQREAFLPLCSPLLSSPHNHSGPYK